MKSLLPHKSLLPRLALLLVLCQLLLILGSWLYGAAFPDSGVHSLLTGEGIRWFLGRFAHVLATPLLVWIVLLSMSYGVFSQSGLLRTKRFTGYRERRALAISAGFLVVYVLVLLLWTLIPRAVLLSATGALWPSPFSNAMVPVIAFGITASSTLYGTIAGNFHSLQDVYDSLLYGIRQASPLLLFYVLLIQFYYSCCFVLP